MPETIIRANNIITAYFCFIVVGFSFMHDKDEAATGLAGELRGEAINVGDSPGAIRGISKV